jgi:starch phosphorylase
VRVELVHGRVDADDTLVDSSVTPLALVETYDGSRFRFDGEVALDRSGPFGYTVRVVPTHPLLVSPAELGVVALA